MPGTPRIPPEAAGIQVNFCKSPLCPNFHRPASAARPYKVKGTVPAPGDYTISGLSKANPGIKCAFCGEISPMRSNLAIAEELWRLSGDLLFDPVEPACRTPGCRLKGTPLSAAKGQYVRFGQSAAGTPRYRCKACRKTFSGPAKPLARQRRSEKNRDVFLLLMNKSPISRMQETTGLHPKAIYDKMAFIHRQCQAFGANREVRLADPGLELPTVYLAVDRQHYVVNWSQRTDRRTVQLNAIASADVASGYVFGFHLNFDPTLDSQAVSADAAAVGDIILDAPFRKHARVWLPGDYAEASANAGKRDAASSYLSDKGPSFKHPLLAEIEATYVDALIRDDVEESDHKNAEVRLPRKGMQVHEQYTMYAHFFLLARLLRNAPKVRLFMDLDSGFRAAFMAAFAQRILDRTADGFFVKVGKDANAYQKQNAVWKAKQHVEQVAADHDLSVDEAKLEIMKAQMDAALPLGKWHDKWVMHPLPIAAEPFKAVCWLTDLGDYDRDHAARLYLRATLHPVDRFFMQTRRRLSMAERPVVSVRKQRTMWHGYGAYNPGNLARFLEIYRTYYNYCLAGKDKQTPAMRLGLARAVIDPQDVLYFER